MDTPTTDELMLTPSAAAHIGCHAHTLYVWRTQGRGPRYFTISAGERPTYLYARSDLDAFIAERAQRLAVAK